MAKVEAGQKISFDLHHHSASDDGQMTISQFVRAIAKVGLHAVAYTPHSEFRPLPYIYGRALMEDRTGLTTLYPGFECDAYHPTKKGKLKVVHIGVIAPAYINLRDFRDQSYTWSDRKLSPVELILLANKEGYFTIFNHIGERLLGSIGSDEAIQVVEIARQINPDVTSPFEIANWAASYCFPGWVKRRCSAPLDQLIEAAQVADVGVVGSSDSHHLDFSLGAVYTSFVTKKPYSDQFEAIKEATRFHGGTSIHFCPRQIPLGAKEQAQLIQAMALVWKHLPMFFPKEHDRRTKPHDLIRFLHQKLGVWNEPQRDEIFKLTDNMPTRVLTPKSLGQNYEWVDLLDKNLQPWQIYRALNLPNN